MSVNLPNSKLLCINCLWNILRSRNEIESDFFKNGGWEIVDLEIPKSMQHILSDYKRVLKENEQLHTEVNSLKIISMN